MSRKEKKDWDLDTLLSIVGFVFELVRVTVNALRKRGGNVNHLRRLLKEPALVDRVFDLVVAPSAAEKPVFAAGDYSIYVGYEMPHDKATLEAEFSEGHDLSLFYGNHEWEYHSSCVGIDQAPGERLMRLEPFDGDTGNETTIAAMDTLGYRPAIHLEAYAFARSRLELLRHVRIIALGAFVRGAEYPGVPLPDSVNPWEICDHGEFGLVGCIGTRSLFVRK